MATLIHDVTELQAMSGDLTADYELANDIDATITSTWNAGAGFLPIGGILPNRFTGTFDGKGYSIDSLFINRSTTNGQALFGFTRGSTIQNVSLTNVTITGQDYVGALIGAVYGDPDPCTIKNCSSSGTVTATQWEVGGLIGGLNDATVSNCHSSCTVNSSYTYGYVGGLIGEAVWEAIGTITNCYATGNVQSKYYAGGLIGSSENYVVTKSYATGTVSDATSTTTTYLGGLIGYVYLGGTLSDCYARGNIISSDVGAGRIGGLIGKIDAGTVDNCYSTGLITVASAPSKSIGGLIGSNGTGIITSCYWDTQTSGQALSDGGTGKTTAQMKQKSTFSGWNIIPSGTNSNNGYPYLSGTTPIWKIYASHVTSPRSTKPIEDKITLELIRNVEMSAHGRAFIDKEGKFHYDSRHGRNPC